MKRKFFSAPAVLIAMVLLANASQAQVKNENRSADLPKSITINSINSDGSDATEMNYTQDGQRYKVRLKGSRIVEMFIDDKRIPASDFSKYEPGIRKILEQVEED